MKRFLLPVLALLAAPLAAQETPAPDAGQHDVRRGDTLWDLAAQYLGDPFRWPEIWALNRDIVADPHRIYPREMLRIPGYNYPAGAVQDTARPRTVFFPTEVDEGGGLLVEVEEARRTVVTEGDFYRAGFLARDGEIRPLARIAAVRSPSVLSEHQLNTQVEVYDQVYLTGWGGAPSVRVGDRLHLWRPGREVAGYGRVYESTGQVVVLSVEGTTATARVEQLYDKMQLGDVALPVREFDVAANAPTEPAGGLEGRILAFEEPHTLHGVYDLAFVDLGGQSGVREGDEFAVVLPPRQERWGVRPEIEVARLQVVRADARTSTARVVHLEHPALQAGLPIRLVGKIP